MSFTHLIDLTNLFFAPFISLILKVKAFYLSKFQFFIDITKDFILKMEISKEDFT